MLNGIHRLRKLNGAIRFLHSKLKRTPAWGNVSHPRTPPLLFPNKVLEHFGLKDLPGMGFVLGTGDAAFDDAGGTAPAGEVLFQTFATVLSLADIPGAESLNPGGFVDMDSATRGIGKGSDVED